MSFYDDASLVLIPSGYKAGKVYSQKPLSTNGELTFTRASHATRVNAAGNVEKARTNNLLQSNTFSNASWSKAGVTLTGGQTDKDGGTDAWKLIQDTSTGYHFISQVAAAGLYALSIYAKAGEYSTIGFYQNNLSASASASRFNLSTGVWAANNHNAVATSVGNGWYRISLPTRATTSDAYTFYAYQGSGPETGDGTSGIYIQDAQLEQGLVATDYIETTTAAVTVGIYNDVPRLDYSGGSCPALLLEPQRTNQVTYSEYFDASYWSKTNSTIINNAVLSPEGLQNATELFDNATSGAHFVYKSAISASSNHIISFFAKANTLSQVFVNGGASLYAYVDLINGVKLSGTADTTIENYGNGWWRISIISDRDGILIATSKNTNNNYSGSGESIYIYGVQSEEAASYPTSYIPTYGASVTRSRDTGSLNMIDAGITTGWTSATLFIEYEKPNTGEGVDTFRMHGTSSNGRAYIYNTGNGFAADWGISGGHTLNTNVKHIWRLDSLSEGTRFKNGAKENSGSGTAWSDIRYMYLNNQGLGGTLKIKQIALFPTALTDSECIALTTL